MREEMREDLKVSVEKLKFACDPAIFQFTDTSEVEPLKHFVGQKRAIEALRSGLKIKSQGYNIFATGLTSTGRNAVIREDLNKIAEERKASGEVVLWDFCYVHNFDNPDRPKILIFGKGKGKEFKEKMESAYHELKKKIPQILKSDEYNKAKEELEKKFQGEEEKLQKEIDEMAKSGSITIQWNPDGQIFYGLMSQSNPSETMSKEELAALAEEDRKKLEANLKKVARVLAKFINRKKEFSKGIDKEVDDLQKKIVGDAIGSVLDIIDKDYQPVDKENPGYLDVLNYLDGLKKFVVKNIDAFMPKDQNQMVLSPFGPIPLQTDNGNGNGHVMLQFAVNLFIDNSNNDKPPIIIETNPSFASLFGKIEKKFMQGVYLTDHTMIKPGALCLADGGYLVVNALDLLRNAVLWFKLIKSLKSGLVKIEDAMEAFGYMPATLSPGAVPINVKVIVIGEPMFYHLLFENDPDFQTVFKIRADFDDRMELNEEHLNNYAGFVSFCCMKEKLLPFEPGAVLKVAEYGARLVGDQRKLSTKFGKIKNLIVEANYWANEEHEEENRRRAQEGLGDLEIKSQKVTAKHVQKAVEAIRQRLNLLEERMREFITEGTILIDTKGEKVGQINGLGVYSTGDYAFGMPSRITAETFLGRRGVVSIDREVGRAGPDHNKGVLILSGYSHRKYGKDKTIAFSASLCFEQSYDEIDGDSASVAELIALISSLAEVPIKQNFAVTGSVNQKGEIQPIGGVNQKVEGFFDVCKAKRLTGEQGVVIPHQNVKNLMLREDVVEAVADGKFHVYAIKTIDEGIELLTGQPAEKVHTLVNENLKRMIDLLGPQKGLDEGDDSGARNTGHCGRCGH